MKKQTIFFDFDGTILNSFSLYFKTTKHLNPDISEQEYRDIFLLEKFTDSHAIKYQNHNEFFALISEHAHSYELFPGVQRTLSQLDKDYNLVIVTACPNSVVKFQLSRFRFPRFHKIYGLEKPGTKDSKMSNYCRKYIIEENDCYFITDTVGDVIQAKKTNINTVAVSYGFNSRQQLTTVQPDEIVDSFPELLSVIKKHP